MAAAAPGKPGIRPYWTSSAKSGVGTAVTSASRVWFTLSHGIVDEVYYPWVDQANTRDFGLIVTDGVGFFSEEKRDTDSRIEPLAPGVPGYRLTNTDRAGRYRIEKTVFTDPDRDVLVVGVRFVPLSGRSEDYHVYALLAPHVANQGAGNDAWVGEYKGVSLLCAERAGTALALACSADWRDRSAGYVGISDGWQDLKHHGRMTWEYGEARDGNVALTGEVDLANAPDGAFTLAVGFGRDPYEAGNQARAALLMGAEELLDRYVEGWKRWQDGCQALGAPKQGAFDLYRVSTAVLRTHEGKRAPGALVASLSIPWGRARSDQGAGGYHLIWPRDQVESAGALLAAGNAGTARDTLFYLMTTQDADGHWPQVMWMNGQPYWNGIQLDETGFFILLADLLRRHDALDTLDPWPTVRKALSFLIRQGPSTGQDRWEAVAGFSPFTLAVLVAALLAGADFADTAGEVGVADYLRETADIWNDAIDAWTYVRDTPLARAHGITGYYVRIAPPEVARTGKVVGSVVSLDNQPSGAANYPAEEIVSPDALALVRFGLRAADDPRITDTMHVVDATLKTETRTGPVWHRFTHDGYGETAEGRPYAGVGSGRGWPLLTGERAHYELARGDRAAAERLQKVMTAQASDGGLLPEQVWDADDIPAEELFSGRPSGSAMPLVWAHAEYVKLVRSLHEGSVFDMPSQTSRRYLSGSHVSPIVFWRFGYERETMPAGKRLRIETAAPALVRWSDDGWRTARDAETRDTSLGLYVADLPTESLASGSTVSFTFRWTAADRWEGRNFAVAVVTAER